MTYSLPDDIKPSCAEAAEYRLELNYHEDVVGSYTDGTTAKQSFVTGKLSRGTVPVWEEGASGGKPPAQKYWGGRNDTGSRADAAPMVLRAIRTIRTDRNASAAGNGA